MLSESFKDIDKIKGNNRLDRHKVNPSFKQSLKPNPTFSKPNNAHIQTRYKTYQKNNYPSFNSRKFRAMRSTIGGLGGVIFGNEVIDGTKPPDLGHIKFIPSEFISPDSLPMGTLEFVF